MAAPWAKLQHFRVVAAQRAWLQLEGAGELAQCGLKLAAAVLVLQAAQVHALGVHGAMYDVQLMQPRQSLQHGKLPHGWQHHDPEGTAEPSGEQRPQATEETADEATQGAIEATRVGTTSTHSNAHLEWKLEP